MVLNLDIGKNETDVENIDYRYTPSKMVPEYQKLFSEDWGTAYKSLEDMGIQDDKFICLILQAVQQVTLNRNRGIMYHTMSSFFLNITRRTVIYVVFVDHRKPTRVCKTCIKG